MPQLTSDQRHALWSERLARFQATDVTVLEFCRREAISVPSFYNWKKRLNQTSTSKRRRRRTAASNAKFVPVVVNTAAVTTTKLNLPGGASIDLPSELDARQIADLIGAVIEVTVSRNRQQEKI